MRDVLYVGLPLAQRRHRHRRVAEAIEAQYGHDLDEHVDRLADHHLRSLPDGDAGRALDYARRAGQRALATLAYEQAARQFTRAVDLAARPAWTRPSGWSCCWPWATPSCGPGTTPRPGRRTSRSPRPPAGATVRTSSPAPHSASAPA